MSWRDCFREIEKLIESDEFKKMNAKCNPNDPATALSLALRELYNKYNVWGHKI